MSSLIGIGFSLSALFFWALGDFLIQKSTRLIGSWKSLFVNCAVAAIILTPFVARQLLYLSVKNWLVVRNSNSSRYHGLRGIKKGEACHY